MFGLTLLAAKYGIALDFSGKPDIVILKMKKCFTPVIHVKSLEQTIPNVEICMEADVYGVWLINHRISCNKLLGIVSEIRSRYPKLWIGINVLDKHPLSAIHAFKGLDLQGYWADNPEVYEISPEQGSAQAIHDAVRNSLPHAGYFGGVAFKYQVQPLDLVGMTKLACKYMDVVTTSGDATGVAPDVSKIKTMAESMTHPNSFAVASGITIDNVKFFTPYVNWYLVATSISKDFENLDANLVKQLKSKIYEEA